MARAHAVNPVLAADGGDPLPWRALLSGWHTDSEYHYVLMQYRLPRVVLALIIGAALAVSGALVQGIVHNPLASPDILGINHGASLTSVAALWFLPSLPRRGCRCWPLSAEWRRW
jgi:iron complex transport system permease protein